MYRVLVYLLIYLFTAPSKCIGQIPIGNSSFEGWHQKNSLGACWDSLIQNWEQCDQFGRVDIYTDTTNLGCNEADILPIRGHNSYKCLHMNLTPNQNGSLSQELQCNLKRGKQYHLSFYATTIYTNFSGNNICKAALWLSNDTCAKEQRIYLSDTLPIGWQLHDFAFIPDNDYSFLRLDGIPLRPLINNVIGYDEISAINFVNGNDVQATGGIKDTVIKPANCITLTATPSITTYDSVQWRDAAGAVISTDFTGGQVCPATSTYYVIAMRDTVPDCAGYWWSYDTVRVTVSNATGINAVEEVRFKCYPTVINSNRRINIESEQGGVFNLLDALGRQVMEAKFEKGYSLLPLQENMQQGCYIYNVTLLNGVKKSGRVIVY